MTDEGQGTGRRAHHRRRRVGRRGRPTPRRGGHRRALPGAGRLARSDGVPRRRARLGAHGPQAVVGQPQHPRAARRLSGRRCRFGHLTADVRRRRRLDAAVRRRVAALVAVGLPGAHARRRRRRLAAQLCRAPAVLRAQRPAHRRVGSRRRPGVPAGRGSAAAAAADRRRRAEGRQGAQPARMALVARAQRDPLGALPGAQPVRPAGHLHAGLQRGCEGLDRPHPLAGGDRPRRPVGDRRPRAQARNERPRPRHGCHVARIARAASTSKRRAPWSSPPTASGHLGCSSCRPRRAIPTASRTRAASSGGD